MIDAQTTDHKSLSKILTLVKEGKFMVPNFQRDFEWKPWDISELMKSIFLDYYIGNLLLWKGKPENYKSLSCQPIYGHSGQGSPDHIVLDGQQRLTAIHYALAAPDIPLPKRKMRAVYFLDISKFMQDETDEAFSYQWVGPKVKAILADEEFQFETHMFPLLVMGLKEGFGLYNWTAEYEIYWKKKVDSIEKKLAETSEETNNEQIKSDLVKAKVHTSNAGKFKLLAISILNDYQISYIELDAEISVPKVCDIFTQINSRGIRLDIFDLLNAMLVPDNIELKKMWQGAEERLSFANSDKMNVYVLQVMSLLRQNYCSPKFLYYLLPRHKKVVRDGDGSIKNVVLIASPEEFVSLWAEAVNAIELSLKLLSKPQDYGVTSSKYLPYVSIVPVFSTIQQFIKLLAPEKRFGAQSKARQWYWASVFLNRYSGSVESTAARDFLDFKKWLNNADDEPSIIGEFKERFRNLELKKEVKRGTSVYNGVFNLLVIAGARDWYSGTIPDQDDLDDHHIVPASWGKNNNLGRQINTILNRTPLSSETNRKFIRDKLPNQYLPILIEQNGKSKVKKILHSHFISERAMEVLMREGFSVDDFEEFIQIRQKTIQDAMETHLFGERVEIPVRLDEISTDIESVERKLRNFICNTLDDDIDLIPDAVLNNAETLFERELKNSPKGVHGEIPSMQSLLQFCDLRGLEEIITNKGLWIKFEDVLKNKTNLTRKFSQLAGVRNPLAHHREIETDILKEGEAAILWFEKMLRHSVA